MKGREMAQFFDVAGTPLIVCKSGKALAWEDGRLMSVPAGLVAAGTELTIGAFERTFPQVDMKHLFNTIGAQNPLALLAKAHMHLAESAADEEEVDYIMEILEKTWQKL
jgi:hypothetical protein